MGAFPLLAAALAAANPSWLATSEAAGFVIGLKRRWVVCGVEATCPVFHFSRFLLIPMRFYLFLLLAVLLAYAEATVDSDASSNTLQSEEDTPSGPRFVSAALRSPWVSRWPLWNRFLSLYGKMELHVGKTTFTSELRYGRTRIVMRHRRDASVDQRRVPLCLTTMSDDQIFAYLKYNWRNGTLHFRRGSTAFVRFAVARLCQGIPQRRINALGTGLRAFVRSIAAKSFGRHVVTLPHHGSPLVDEDAMDEGTMSVTTFSTLDDTRGVHDIFVVILVHGVHGSKEDWVLMRSALEKTFGDAYMHNQSLFIMTSNRNAHDRTTMVSAGGICSWR